MCTSPTRAHYRKCLHVFTQVLRYPPLFVLSDISTILLGVFSPVFSHLRVHFMFFGLCQVVCSIFVALIREEATPPAVEGWGPNRWTTREIPHSGIPLVQALWS